MNLEQLLSYSKHKRASDTHLISGNPPQIRVDGILKSVEMKVLSGKDIETMIKPFISEESFKSLQTKSNLSLSINFLKAGRFRVSIYKIFDEMAINFRAISSMIPTLDGLHTPKLFKELIANKSGLILVSGFSGSGRSSTVTAMINEINENFHKHILIVGSPIEFIHKSKRSVFSYIELKEAELDQDTVNDILKIDFDVIFFEELNSEFTIRTALTLAENGHLVFGILNRNSAVNTIDELLSHNINNFRISENLIAIISQFLIPQIGGGQNAVFEILLNDLEVSRLISQNKISQIISTMEISPDMTTQTTEILNEIKHKHIKKDVGINYSNNKTLLLKQLEES
jgi:twitching motility protein PilT